MARVFLWLCAAVLALPAAATAQSSTVGDLVELLRDRAASLEQAPEIQRDYTAFLGRHGLAHDPELLRDFSRVRLVFEATRDGGLFGLRWAVTDRPPDSEAIWSQWGTLPAGPLADGAATATAECDELSALFAFLVRQLGVTEAGLYWPTWNHTVAVWTVRSPGRKDLRVVVPTSQVFLDRHQGLDTSAFNPWTQTTIYRYGRKDVALDRALPAELLRFFRAQLELHGGASAADLQALRNLRGGS